MNPEEKERLLITFQDHVHNVTNLHYGSYLLAETLTQKTKRLATRYFPERPIFVAEINKINFKLPENKNYLEVNVWNESYRRLLTVSQAMLDEAQLPSGQSNASIQPINETPEDPTTKGNKIYAVSFLIFTSFLLWTFDVLVKWPWLTFHPKKTAIYLSIQVAIIFTFSLFFTNNKQVRFIEWFAIAVSIATSVISLMY